MLAKKILFCASLLTLFFISPLARAESDGEISDTHPLNINKPIFRISVSGRVTFEKESSYLRIVLVDKDLNEYLVYETYPLLADSNSFAFNDVCQETCALNSVSPVSLKIFGEGVTYAIDKIFSVDNLQQLRIANIAEERESLKTRQEEQKIKKLNEQIKVKGMNWIAGKTSVSDLSYEEKKKLFRKEDGTPVDRLPNLQGFEYYKGGIFEIKSDTPGLSVAQEASPSALPTSWDWRNVHGENWMTPTKDQGSGGTCWAHANIGALESQINLYYNQRLNLNLSEQMLIDCINNGHDYNPNDISELSTTPHACDWSIPGTNCVGRNYCKQIYVGVTDESCDPYNQREIGYNCDYNHICTDWGDRLWKISDFWEFDERNRVAGECLKQVINPSEEEIKRALITKGPIDGTISNWFHAMVLVGYGGSSDWRVVQSCNWDEQCVNNSGCIKNQCDTAGEQMSFCVNDFYYYGPVVSAVYNNECKDLGGRREWVNKSVVGCMEDERCVDNRCQAVSKFNLAEGHRECSSNDFLYSKTFRELSEYAPSQGETYWIFKNSWGNGWGENGYARINVSVKNLGYGSIPAGPIIPPTDNSYWPAGFDGEIKCVDKDNDRYCNWGISEIKPPTCPESCKPQKDCNDSDPILGPFDENFNCHFACQSSAQGDLNCDNLINETDLSVLLARWGEANLPTIATLLQNWETGF